MHNLAVLCVGLLSAVAVAAPIEGKLNTIIPNYADLDGAVADKRAPKLKTIIHNYADVDGSVADKRAKLNTIIPDYADIDNIDGSAEKRQLNTAIEEATATEKRGASPVQPIIPVGTLNTIIHHYADVEGHVY